MLKIQSIDDNFLRRATAMLALSAGLWTAGVPIGRTIELGDGTVYFERPPSLEAASLTFDTVRAWSSTYFFTLDVPDNAGEPLQRITIEQHEGFDRRLQFNTDETLSFEGTRSERGETIALSEVTHDRATQTVSIVFDPPVAPGTVVTVGLRPVRNPRVAGVYLFGVTAFPAGESDRGQFLGYGRLHIYSNGGFE
ncbi:MAG: DUF2808 domain-containing protein [Cyanobacteriota bacterium]|nr:DUF2808 domain-containing protein [Cyanobacteriota bacterium]